MSLLIKRLLFTAIFNSCLFVFLFIGIQNSSNKNKVDLLIDETIEIFFDLNLAKRSCKKEQKVLKVPNTDVFRIASPILLSKGISRIVCPENLIAL